MLGTPHNNYMSFITHLLSELDGIKAYHWSCTSYARHKASDELYTKLSKLVDDFVEIYIGEQNKRPSFDPNKDVIRLHNCSDDEAISHLQNLAKWLATDLKDVVGDSVSLGHILEEMSSTVHHAIYMFTFN